MNWRNSDKQTSKDYTCGYCGVRLASENGYIATEYRQGSDIVVARIYICHKCKCPTFFNDRQEQTPGPVIGNPVKHIKDKDIEKLFSEAKACFSIGAYTSAVMNCRKLLMAISVTEGATEGLGFVEYVNYLDTKNFIPPNGRKWVDSIRKLGNEANHKIAFRDQNEATRIMNFTEMLLRFIYELPGIMEETV